MTPSSDSCSGYDSFWSAAETRSPRAMPPDGADAYAAFLAAVDG
jgi:hypothetical protein